MDARKMQLLAMALTKGMTAELMEQWFESGATATDFFAAPGEELRHILSLDIRHSLSQANRHNAMERAQKESQFIERHAIKVWFALNEDYPWRLRELSGAPAVLFGLGEGKFDTTHAVSVVGTRRPTPYGVTTCQSFIGQWSEAMSDLTIISGLAYGVDAVAHTAALELNMPTIAVVAHGLDRIYPAQHRDLARRIINSNGLIVSQYPSGTSPYKPLFLERNRIIAGLADATVVIESGYRGGALSTANAAFEANREVFALPGRVNDEMSMGCNKLIGRQKAHILNSAETLLNEMRWNSKKAHIDSVQRSLFPVLTEVQLMIHGLLKKASSPLTPDDLQQSSGLPMSVVMSTLGEMEFEGLVVKYPGNRFNLN